MSSLRAVAETVPLNKTLRNRRDANSMEIVSYISKKFNSMKRTSSKEIVTEVECPSCEGTGFPTVKQPMQPGRKLYPAPCKECLGKGRIGSTAAAER
jgi:DnaJ-class molecular chaperone